MYIKNLTKSHIPEIARLEGETYPESMCLGAEDYQDDFKKYEKDNFSTGIFVEGSLKAYVIAYKEKINNTKNSRLYVSDFVCQDIKLLEPLLLYFLNSIYTNTSSFMKKSYSVSRKDSVLLYAEFRKSSYEMLMNLIKNIQTISLLRNQFFAQIITMERMLIKFLFQ